MAVQFILGRSGTGKTSYCIKAIVESLLKPDSNQPLILLVPEQASYQAERAILSDSRIAGYNRLNVLSFDRLQFLLLGKNTAKPRLTRLGQQMIVHKLLRDSIDKLKVFDTSASQPGLGRLIAETIAELHQYAKTPDDIDELLSKLQKDEHSSLTALKFADVGLVFKEYLKFIEDRFLDPDVQLTGARQAVAQARFIKGAKLWVDGFAGFGAAELEILAELLKAAAEAQIALCLDWSKIDLVNPDIQALDPISLFSPTERTYCQLIEIVKKCKLQLAEPIVLKKTIRFSNCRQLAHIERNIFETEPAKISAADNVRIISAPNARAEVKFIARQILQLVKERNYRYSDIGVIASDIDSYQHYIRAHFDDYGIPFFIDKRKSLNYHPLAGLVCSALQAVSGGFSSSDIFCYLKTDLVPIERREIDLLENYCLAFGVSDKDWQSGKDWHFAGQEDGQFDEQHINRIRPKVSQPLLRLRDKLCGVGNPEETVSADEFTRAVFQFLADLGIREKIGRWIEKASEQKDDTSVDEHRQFYNKFIDIFDELVEAFGSRQMAWADFAAIVSSAFSQMELAFIPPTLDQVLVGSIERSRHPNLKAVFLTGAAQRQFPAPVSFESILTEDDRKIAEAADFPLAATVSQALAERQYLAYIAFTRPSQLLYVTYPLTDEKGSAAVRSQFIANLESLFENLSEQSIVSEPTDIEKVHSKAELADLLCSRLGKDTSRYSAIRRPVEILDARYSEHELLLDDICVDEQLRDIGAMVRSAINYDNAAKLDKEVVEKFFARQIELSATRLGTFAACRYQYFARYILELKERQEFKFEPLDVGNFYHQVLDALLKRLNKEKKDFAAIEKLELLKLLAEEMSNIVQTDSFVSNFVRHSRHNAFIIHSAGEILEDCVLAIAQMAGAGRFLPKLSEAAFVFDLKNSKLLMRGKIDRLDIAVSDGETAAIVFDYKRTDKSFSWAKFYYGLDMQLPIYILAARLSSLVSRLWSLVAGAFYMPVEASPTKATLDELPEKAESFDYKAKGIFNGKFAKQLDGAASKDSEFYNFYVTKDGEPYGSYENRGILKPADFEKVLKFTEKKIVELAEEILSGRIDIKPYRLSGKSPCSYCKYKALCRFDWQVNDYNFLEPLDKSGVLEKIE